MVVPQSKTQTAHAGVILSSQHWVFIGISLLFPCQMSLLHHNGRTRGDGLQLSCEEGKGEKGSGLILGAMSSPNEQSGIGTGCTERWRTYP